MGKVVAIHAGRDRSADGSVLVPAARADNVRALRGLLAPAGANPFTDALNQVRKYVASMTLSEPLGWAHSTLLKGDAADAVAALREQQEDTLVVFGSGVLLQSLARRGLVDEYVLQIHPLVLGPGRRLFSEAGPLAKFRLADSVTTATGVIIATYQKKRS